jgi:RpiR family glv operon transcriptional regulator
MDFYKSLSGRAANLSDMEKVLFNYTSRNLHLIKDMNIRRFAETNFVSTSTVLRYVRKLGFKGWTEFQSAVRETERQSRELTIPNIIYKDNYRDSYLKNIIEAVKIITDEKLERFNQIMRRYPKIYILASGLSEEVALYIYRLLTSIGYDTEFPRADYEVESVMRRIKREDVLLVLSYSGNNTEIVGKIEKIFNISTPVIISITRADNNMIQNMSDLNFYIFADEISYSGIDVTSRCGMIAILEVLLYEQMTKGTAE